MASVIMENIKSKIIEDLKFLAEKAEAPLVKIAYAMAITIVELHFESKGDGK